MPDNKTTIPLISTTGNFYQATPEEAPELIQQGYQQPSQDQIQDQARQDKYGTLGQQAITGLEGAASALTLGGSTGLERLAGVKPEDIQGRREVNPGVHGLGAAAGLVGSAFIPGLGEAAGANEAATAAKAAAPIAEAAINPLSAQSIMSGLGAKLAKVSGLGGEGAGALSNIGSSGIKGAVETAIFQGGDEISKMLSSDPNQSVGTAAANVGLAGLIGGGAGGALGAVSPLWKSAMGTKTGQFIDDFKTRIGEYLKAPGAGEAIPAAAESNAVPVAEEAATTAAEPETREVLDPFTKKPIKISRSVESNDSAPGPRFDPFTKKPMQPTAADSSISQAPAAAEEIEPATEEPVTKERATKKPATELSPGAKLADLFIKKGLSKLAGEGLGASIGGALGSTVGHGAIGAMIGERALSPFLDSILPSITKPILEGVASSEGLKSAVDYGLAVMRGETLVNRAASAIFKSGVGVLPESVMPSEKDRDRLEKSLKKLQANPSPLLDVGGSIGHYLPQHGMALGQTTANAVSYLNGLRPQMVKQSPLDSEMKPSPEKVAAYNNALDIAQQPLIVLDKVKRGTVSPQDLTTLHTLYPSLYEKVASKLMDAMVDHISKDGKVPYQTRIGLSLFLGQPLDSTLTPQAIQANQLAFRMAPKSTDGMQAEAQTKKSTSSLNKIGQLAMTSTQARQAARSKI